MSKNKITWPQNVWIVSTSGILTRTCADLKEANRTAEHFTEDGALDIEIQVYTRLGKPKRWDRKTPTVKTKKKSE